MGRRGNKLDTMLGRVCMYFIVIAQLHFVFLLFQNSEINFSPVDYSVNESMGYLTLSLVASSQVPEPYVVIVITEDRDAFSKCSSPYSTVVSLHDKTLCNEITIQKVNFVHGSCCLHITCLLYTSPSPRDS